MQPVNHNTHSLANNLSIYPFVQQAVGVATIASNSAKVVNDIKNVIVSPIKSLFSPTDGGLENAKAKFKEHKAFIGVGFKRLLPVVGSIYSYNRASPTQQKKALIIASLFPVTQQVIGLKQAFSVLKEGVNHVTGMRKTNSQIKIFKLLTSILSNNRENITRGSLVVADGLATAIPVLGTLYAAGKLIKPLIFKN